MLGIFVGVSNLYTSSYAVERSGIIPISSHDLITKPENICCEHSPRRITLQQHRTPRLHVSLAVTILMLLSAIFKHMQREENLRLCTRFLPNH